MKCRIIMSTTEQPVCTVTYPDYLGADRCVLSAARLSNPSHARYIPTVLHTSHLLRIWEKCAVSSDGGNECRDDQDCEHHVSRHDCTQPPRHRPWSGDQDAKSLQQSSRVDECLGSLQTSSGIHERLRLVVMAAGTGGIVLPRY